MFCLRVRGIGGTKWSLSRLGWERGLGGYQGIFEREAIELADLALLSQDDLKGRAHPA